MSAAALQGRSIFDVTGLAEHAKAVGLKLDSGPGDLGWGPIGFTLTDPDGYKLTIAAAD